MLYHRAKAELGAERAGALWRLTERTLDRMESLAGDALRRVGSVRLAADEKERDELRAEYAALSDDGFAVEWTDEPGGRLSNLYSGGLVHPRDGALDAGRWIRRWRARGRSGRRDPRA